MSPDSTPHPIPPDIAEAAMTWWVELQCEPVDADTQTACQCWRSARPEHERAWQIIAGAHQRLNASGLPGALARATLATPRSPARRQAIKALAVLIFAGGSAWTVHREGLAPYWLADYRTATGERRQVVLADGTQVTLDSGSALDVRFDGLQRQLQLRAGRIHIATAPDDAGRPFFVESAEGRAQALGTRFSVDQRRGSTQVAVFAGVVALHPKHGASRPFLLNAGQQASFDTSRAGEPVATLPSDAAWQQGMLIVSAMRLDAFAAELGRYRPGWLICDPLIAELQVSGSFPLDDTERVLDALANTLPVQIVRRTRYWAAIQPRATAG
jgi:transmembrane sensor